MRKKRHSALAVEALEHRVLLAAPDPAALATLDGSNGFRLDGAAGSNLAGYSVSDAGDVNGDGFDDLIVGAPFAHGSTLYAGASYVVFGQSEEFASAINLSALDGRDGFRLDGVSAGDESGTSVSGAGDVNGDGFDDLIVGARRSDSNGHSSGSSYVIFGKEDRFSSVIQLCGLDGTNGFRLDGVDSNDLSGRSVSGGGDINGDGLDDLIIGASEADGNGDQSGEAYVVFGQEGDFASAFSLSSLDGANGFRLAGVSDDRSLGGSVSIVGDVDGDGIDDLVASAIRNTPDGEYTASSYVVFGRSDGFASSFDLTTLDGFNGIRIGGDGVFSDVAPSVTGCQPQWQSLRLQLCSLRSQLQ